MKRKVITLICVLTCFFLLSIASCSSTGDIEEPPVPSEVISDSVSELSGTSEDELKDNPEEKNESNVTSKEESRTISKEESKATSKEESKQPPKEESKEPPKEEPKEPPKEEPKEPPKEEPKEPPKNSSELLEKFDVNGDGKLGVFFIGNSFTYTFDIPAKFKNIAKTQGVELEIYVKAEPGNRLSKHLEELPSYSDYIKNADIVVLQDHGGFIGPETVPHIPKIQALFNKNVKFYYYPFIATSNFYKQFDIKNIIFVPTGDIFDELTKVYSSETFIVNYHNNDLCSYIFANAIYCVIFDADCTDFPYETIITPSDALGRLKEINENELYEYRKIVMRVLKKQ